MYKPEEFLTSPREGPLKKDKLNRVSWAAIVLKLGPKFSKIFITLIKILKGGGLIKTGLAAASIGFYTLLFSWQMAVGLVLFLLIHEYGHMWAMKRCGMKTRGMYLIPGFGAVALAGERWKSAHHEAFIAIMGPLFGFFFIIPAVVWYHLTGNPMFAVIAAFAAFINLINLFPINPLDGGRIVKSILYSVASSFGILFMFVSLGLSIYISARYGFWLLSYIALIGVYETIASYGLKKSLLKFFKTLARAFAVGLLIIVWRMDPSFDFHKIVSLLTTIFAYIFAGVIFVLLLVDISSATKNEERPTLQSIAAYPVIIILDIFRAIKEIFSIKISHLSPIENYPPMPRKTMLFYSLYYILTAAGMVFIIAYASSIPGLEGTKELLK